ncbi:Hypothetical predicted protein, partial [Paramuricea clavata]
MKVDNLARVSVKTDDISIVCSTLARGQIRMWDCNLMRMEKEIIMSRSEPFLPFDLHNLRMKHIEFRQNHRHEVQQGNVLSRYSLNFSQQTTQRLNLRLGTNTQ